MTPPEAAPMPEPPTVPGARPERYPLPIFLFVGGLLGVTVAMALAEGGAARGALAAAGAVALALVHALLHWYAPRARTHDRTWFQYALAQGALGVAVTFAAGSPSVWAAAFTWLLGEAAGMLERARLAGATLALYALFAVAALFAIVDASTALSWLGATLPTAAFVGLVVVLYRRQVEARERLAAANEQISAYARQVEQLTLANERQRLARELHDTLAQDMAGLVLQLEAVDAHLAAGRTERGQSIVQQAMERARTALRDARAAIDDLRARDGVERLSERLERLARRFREESGVDCRLVVDLGVWDTGLPAAHQEQLERVAAEALSNVRRHAGAAHAEVEVRAMGDRLTLRAADDGAGFEPDELPATGHYGLHGLRERARLLKGTLRIESAPGAGTVLTLDVPLGTTAGPENPAPPGADIVRSL